MNHNTICLHYIQRNTHIPYHDSFQPFENQKPNNQNKNQTKGTKNATKQIQKQMTSNNSLYEADIPSTEPVSYLQTGVYDIIYKVFLFKLLRILIMLPKSYGQILHTCNHGDDLSNNLFCNHGHVEMFPLVYCNLCTLHVRISFCFDLQTLPFLPHQTIEVVI